MLRATGTASAAAALLVMSSVQICAERQKEHQTKCRNANITMLLLTFCPYFIHYTYLVFEEPSILQNRLRK